MSNISTFPSLRELATRLREDLNSPTKPAQIILIYAYNRTGKTRLSMEFKDAGKVGVTHPLTTENGEQITTETGDVIEGETAEGDTLYFNAYTEDLFTWDNDLENDTARGLNINQGSRFFDAFTNDPLEPTIDEYVWRYADFEFDFTFNEVRQGGESFSRPVFVSFSKGEESRIKISRGEQNIFIWCVFMAILEQVLKFPDAYAGVKYVFIDDPISSLDDNNAIAIACDLAQLLRRAASRKDSNGDPAPIKVVFSSHHALFFNVMCNELGRPKEGETKVRHKRYFMHRPNGDGDYTLRATEDTPFFHHVATLAELQLAADPVSGKLYTFHFNALRSVMEKTASFFGHSDIGFCLKALNIEDDLALYNRALNLLSHGKYAIHEPTEMGEDNKKLFRRILSDFTTKFQFALPDIVEVTPAAAPAAGATP